MVSWLVTTVEHRSAEVARARAEAETLARVDELRAGAARRRLPRPADAAGVDQGVGDEPAARRRRLVARAATPSSRAIDEETDRLTALVGNLLDMSRLQTGALQLGRAPVGLEEVVPAALASLGDRPERRVDVDVPRRCRGSQADPALLERALANLVANAAGLVAAGARPGRGRRGRRPGRAAGRRPGPGIPLGRSRPGLPAVPTPRRPLHGAGVGLGLAVARGFIEAMGGELTVEDTPGRRR